MKKHTPRLFLEELESRDLLSAAIAPIVPLPVPSAADGVAQTANVSAAQQTANGVSTIKVQPGARPSPPPSGPNSAWLTPDQIRTAYGFDQIPALTLNGQPDPTTYNNTAGKGQTIAIVDVADDPNILSDANVFSSQFAMPLFNQGGSNSPTFTKLNENGQDITSNSSNNSRPPANSSWSSEISLDVEWAHAIAPQANIVLVEANSESTSDVFKAMQTAQNSGASVVSMSWGYNESDSSMQSKMPGYDAQYLTTPPNAANPITFVAATLDNGSRYGVFWPAISPNVVGVGGTTLLLNKSGGYGSENGWNYSTGGISKYEPQPSYQQGVVTQSTTKATNPDVSYAATNFAAYDTEGSYHGWFQAGGTSAGTPQWAGLVALADQERAASDLPSLSSTETLTALYQLAGQQYAKPTNPANPSYFHDITTGSNGAYRAGTGYDLVTGIGTPEANNLVPALANYGTSS